MFCIEDWVYFWRKAGKAVKKSWKTGKAKKVLRKTGKNICVGNRKMPFLSHGNPEKLENMAETGKYNLKFAVMDVSHVFCIHEPEKPFWKLRKAGKAQKDSEKLRKLENQKKDHGKLEKAYLFCGKPETDPLFLALSL